MSGSAVYTIWIKEPGESWRRLPGRWGVWESEGAAVLHAQSVAAGYFAIQVETATGAVVWRG